MWPDKRSDELLLPAHYGRRWRLHHRRELRFVLVERSRNGQKSSFNEVSEMERSFLTGAEFRRQNRQHRSLRDAGLDERARIQTDNRGAVIQRIEVIGPRRLVNRVATPEGDVGHIPP